MENLDRMTQAEEQLITPIIDIQVIFEEIESDLKIYYTSDSDVDTKRVEQRILVAQRMKTKFLTILN